MLSSTLYGGFIGKLCKIQNEGVSCLTATNHYFESASSQRDRNDYRDPGSVFLHWHKHEASQWAIIANDDKVNRGYALRHLGHHLNPEKAWVDIENFYPGDKFGGSGLRMQVCEKWTKAMPFEIIPVAGNHSRVQLKTILPVDSNHQRVPVNLKTVPEHQEYFVSETNGRRDHISEWAIVGIRASDAAVIELRSARGLDYERIYQQQMAAIRRQIETEKNVTRVELVAQLEQVTSEWKRADDASNLSLARVQSELSNAHYNLTVSHEENQRLTRSMTGVQSELSNAHYNLTVSHEENQRLTRSMTELHTLMNESNVMINLNESPRGLSSYLQPNVSNDNNSSSGFMYGKEIWIGGSVLLLIIFLTICVVFGIRCRRKRREKLNLILFNQRNCNINNINPIIRRNNNTRVHANGSEFGISGADMKTIGNVKPISEWKSQTMTQGGEKGESDSVDGVDNQAAQRARSNSDLFEGHQETRNMETVPKHQILKTPNYMLSKSF